MVYQPAWLGQTGTRPGEGRNPHHVAEVGRVAKRSAGVAPVGQGLHAAGQGHRGPAAAAAAGPGGIVGVAGLSEDRVVGLGPGAEFRGVGLADGDGPGLLQAFHDERVPGGHEIPVGQGTEGGSDPLGPHQVLVGHGKAVEGTHSIPGCQGLVGGAGLLPGPVRHQGHDGVDLWIEAIDLSEMGFQHLAGGKLPGPDAPAQLGRGQETDLSIGHRYTPLAPECNRKPLAAQERPRLQRPSGHRAGTP